MAFSQFAPQSRMGMGQQGGMGGMAVQQPMGQSFQRPQQSMMQQQQPQPSSGLRMGGGGGGGFGGSAGGGFGGGGGGGFGGGGGGMGGRGLGGGGPGGGFGGGGPGGGGGGMGGGGMGGPRGEGKGRPKGDGKGKSSKPKGGGVQRPKAAPRAPGPVVGGNYKSILNELAMRACGRPLVKTDVIFTERAPLGQPGGQFVMSVKVPSLDNTHEFQGDAFALKKDAEQSAARKALEYFQGQELPPYTGSAAAQAQTPSTTAGGAAATNSESGNYKSALNELVMRYLNRPLTPEDITFVPRPTAGQGQFCMAVIVSAIDPARQFEGVTQPRKRDAEQSAAKAALTFFKSTISEDKLAKPKKTKGPSSGSGGGGPRGGKKGMPKVWIWIGNLAKGTTWQDLRSHMETVGKTLWVELLSHESGFAMYQTEEGAAKAASDLNGSTLKGNKITVDSWGKKKEAAK